MAAASRPSGQTALYETLVRVATQDAACSVVRVLEPHREGEDVEVLFLSGPAGDGGREPCTAYVTSDDVVLICSGW